MKKDNIIVWIDLFAGAGGVSHGIDLSSLGKVIVAINHDPIAIASHASNHPDTLHYVEDIRHAKLSEIKKILNDLEKDFNVIKCIWGSPDCTQYSKAKGGGAKNRDTRTLPAALYRYVNILKPDYLFVENVEEFLSWGELDTSGKPLTRKNGLHYLQWVNHITQYGYDYDYRIMNAADYGAHTKRKRYIGQFALKGKRIVWPQATHASKNCGNCMFKKLQPWKPVKEVLDLHDEGKSIFARKKPLVEKTLSRIYAGLIKYVANGEDSFIKNYYSGRPAGKVVSIDSPGPTITKSGNISLVQVDFLTRYNGNGAAVSINTPAPTLTKKDRFSKISVQYLDKSYSGKDNHSSIDTPAGTIMKNDKHALITTNFTSRNSPKSGFHQSVEAPAGTLLKTPKMNLVSVTQKEYYLMNPQWNSKGGSIDTPCFTLIARMDKMPPYLIQADVGNNIIDELEEDSPMTLSIKQFMNAFGIVDIKMRMLKVSELKLIQGFEESYDLKGSQTQQKAFIGNSVPPALSKAIATRVAQEYDAIQPKFKIK